MQLLQSGDDLFERPQRGKIFLRRGESLRRVPVAEVDGSVLLIESAD